MSSDRVPDPLVIAVLESEPDRRVAMLTKLAFAAKERPRGASARRLRLLLRDHLDPLTESVLVVARQSGEPVIGLLAKAIRRRQDVALARRLDTALGDECRGLEAVGIACGTLMVAAALAAGPGQDPDGMVDDVARLVGRLHDAGRPNAGIALLRRVLAAFRRAGVARPAGLMSQLAVLLSVVGDLARAETLLRKVLVSVEAAGVPPILMADDWINLASIRSRRHDLMGAVEASQQALRLLERDDPNADLAEDDRQSLLAVALSNHALYLQEVGRLEEGEAAIRRALVVADGLAARDPIAHGGRLVDALINASFILGLRGDLETARTCSGRAVAEAERLPAASIAASGPGMVSGMINHAINLETQGEADHAMEMACRAAELAERLLEKHGRRFLGSAVDAHAVVCNIGLQSEYLREARTAGERALDLAKGLSDDALGFAGLEVLPNLSDIYAKLGRLEAASEAGRQAYRLVCAAEAETAAGGAAQRVDLETRIGIRNIYAKRLADRGQSAEAMVIAREALALALAPAPETDAPAVSAMPAHTLVHLANLLSDLGDLDGALTAAVDAVKWIEHLAAFDSEWADEELPTALYTQAHVLSQQGDVDAVRPLLDRLIALNRRRADHDERSALADLASALEFSAVIANQVGDIERASAEIGEAVADYQRLIEIGGGAFVTDLANGLHHAAMIALSTGDPSTAIERQHRAVALLEGVPEKDANARKLAADALINLGLYHVLLGQAEAGLEATARARDLISDLAQDWLPARQTEIGALVARARVLVLAGRHAEAAGCADQALVAIAATGDDFWHGQALTSRAMALAALGADSAAEAAAQALAFHRIGLDAGAADEVHGYCDAAAVVIDVAAASGTLTEGLVDDLVAPLPDRFRLLTPERRNFIAAELIRAITEHGGASGLRQPNCRVNGFQRPSAFGGVVGAKPLQNALGDQGFALDPPKAGGLWKPSL